MAAGKNLLRLLVENCQQSRMQKLPFSIVNWLNQQSVSVDEQNSFFTRHHDLVVLLIDLTQGSHLLSNRRHAVEFHHFVDFIVIIGQQFVEAVHDDIDELLDV